MKCTSQDMYSSRFRLQVLIEISLNERKDKYGKSIKFIKESAIYLLVNILSGSFKNKNVMDLKRV